MFDKMQNNMLSYEFYNFTIYTPFDSPTHTILDILQE